MITTITSREAVLYTFIEQLEKDKDELLEALKRLDAAFCADDYGSIENRKALFDARAAIARATKGEAK